MPERIDSSVVFEDEQQFLPPFMGVMIVLGSLVACAVVWWAMTNVKGFPSAAIPILSVALMTDLAMCVLLACSKKVTKLQDDGILLRTRPLAFLLNRLIPFDQITSCQVQTPGTGLRLQLSSGQTIVINSQRTDELAALIQARMK